MGTGAAAKTDPELVNNAEIKTNPRTMKSAIVHLTIVLNVLTEAYPTSNNNKQKIRYLSIADFAFNFH
jgi:hypothetical protein